MTPSYRLAMLAYPPRYRRTHGAEIVATANELADGTWSARQAWALVVEGLRTRAHRASGSSAGQAWASGVALALAFGHVLSLGTTVVLFRTTDVVVDGGLPSWAVVLAVTVPALTLIVTTRWPAVVALAVPMALSLVAMRSNPGYQPGYLFSVLSGGPAVGLATVVAVVGDGRRALSPRWAAGLLTVILLGGWALSTGAILQATLAAELLVLPLVGLALVFVDPRPLAAGAASWLTYAFSAATILLVPGLEEGGSQGLLFVAIIVAALLGLVAAWGAGRRALAVAR